MCLLSQTYHSFCLYAYMSVRTNVIRPYIWCFQGLFASVLNISYIRTSKCSISDMLFKALPDNNSEVEKSVIYLIRFS
jgi:hypothetical protein